jgi:hypothetical protein
LKLITSFESAGETGVLSISANLYPPQHFSEIKMVEGVNFFIGIVDQNESIGKPAIAISAGMGMTRWLHC